MILKYFFLIIFGFLFLYGLARPFSSYVARLFLLSGSLLGFLSLIGLEYTSVLANMVGIGRGADLYLYLGLITVFLFIIYTLNRLDMLNKKISAIVKQRAVSEAIKKKEED